MTLVPYYWEGAFAIACALVLLLGCVCEWIRYLRARRASREAAEKRRIDAIFRMGLRSAFMHGLIDERGNVIHRVGCPEDIQ